MFDPTLSLVSRAQPGLAAEELETPIGVESTPQPPDSEQLLEQSTHLYDMAQKYWDSVLGRKRSPEYGFNSKTTQDRESLLLRKFDILKTPSPNGMEIDPETGEEVDRDTLILSTHELLIEQILSDMVEATKQQAAITNEITRQREKLTSDDLQHLKIARAELLQLATAQSGLEKYLSAAKKGVENYELHAHAIDKDSKYNSFMKKMLGLYREQAGAEFDEMQRDGSQLTGTFGWQTDALLGGSKIQALYEDMDDRITRLEAGEQSVEVIHTDLSEEDQGEVAEEVHDEAAPVPGAEEAPVVPASQAEVEPAVSPQEISAEILEERASISQEQTSAPLDASAPNERFHVEQGNQELSDPEVPVPPVEEVAPDDPNHRLAS